MRLLTVSIRKATASNRAFQSRVSASTSEIPRWPYLVLHDYIYLGVGVSGCSQGVPLILDGVYCRMTKFRVEQDETGSRNEAELCEMKPEAVMKLSCPRVIGPLS